MGVKVLEVLRRAATDAALTRMHDHDAELASARTHAAIDAVAELIDAADKLQHVYRLMDTDPDFVRLRTAIARCNGGAA